MDCNIGHLTSTVSMILTVKVQPLSAFMAAELTTGSEVEGGRKQWGGVL